MHYIQMQTLLDNRLQAFATERGLPVAWLNSKFDPEQHQGALWLRPSLQPLEETRINIKGNSSKAKGVYRIEVLAPAGEGEKRLATTVDGLRQYFAGGISLTNQNITLLLDTCKSSAAVFEEKPFCKIGVDIGFSTLLTA